MLSMKFLTIILGGILVLLTGCSKKDTEPTTTNPPVNPPVNTFAGPTYADNYTSISAWASRSQWNLANVHDPTIEKSGEYY